MDRALAEKLSALVVDAALNEIEATGVLIRENLIERILRELLCFDDRAVTLADVRKSADYADRADGGAVTTKTITAGEISDALRPRKSLAEITADALKRLGENCIDPPDIGNPTNRPWQDYWHLWLRKREMLSTSRYLLPPSEGDAG